MHKRHIAGNAGGRSESRRLREDVIRNSFLVLESRYDAFGEGDSYGVRVFKGLSIRDVTPETANRLGEGLKETMIRYIYLQNPSNKTIVNLYPLISYVFCDACRREHRVFFNGVKGSGSVRHLSYECGHVSERAHLDHFRKRLKASGVEW